MKDFFEYINGCEVIEYHEGTAKGKFLYFLLSYLPTILMLALLGVTLVKSHTLLLQEIDCTSDLLACIFIGVLILLFEVMARITKDKKQADFQECCIIRYMDKVEDADMYWITELYEVQKYGMDDLWIAKWKGNRRMAW